MKIKALVAYSHDGDRRVINFNANGVSIISGESKSGKSAIGDIIEYCLGGGACPIADGVLRTKVSWYGLVLQFGTEEMFVARKMPTLTESTTSSCYYEIQQKISVPTNIPFANNTVDGIESILSKMLGINENKHIPLEGQTRHPVQANIRHALFYCFQMQDEIAARKYLFHRQQEDFISQAIKDTLPYFLGSVDEESLVLEYQKSALEKEINRKKSDLMKSNREQHDWQNKMYALISEAQNVGLVPRTLDVMKENLNDLVALLKGLDSWQEDYEANSSLDILLSLQEELSKKLNSLEKIAEHIKDAQTFISQTDNYLEEAKHQRARLSSIGLFDKLNFQEGYCPFCQQTSKTNLPAIQDIKFAIEKLQNNISNVSSEKPHLSEYIHSMLKEEQTIKQEISTIKARIDGIYDSNESASKIRDLNIRKAKVIGKISFWLESITTTDATLALRREIPLLEQRLVEFNKRLDRAITADKTSSALSRISVDMTTWAKDLDMEHASNPYRIDLHKVTVVVDKKDRAVPLQQLGSGSNWVGIHLLAFFALHKFFIERKRPVPRFLFIDQPSQIYFANTEDIDKQKVKEMYEFIFKRVAELKGDLQVIIVDHADLSQDNHNFHEYLLEVWRDGNKFIPENWRSI